MPIAVDPRSSTRSQWRPILAVVAAALTLASGLVPPLVSPAAAATGAVIEGTVRTGETPLGDICVTVSGPSYVSLRTAEDGTYSATGLVPGSYQVQFTDCTSATYVTQYYDGAGSWSSATPVAVQEGETRSGVDADLAPGGSISGTVHDEDGPAAKVCVGAVVPSTGSWQANVQTGVDGRYRIGQLPAGTYKLSFQDCGTGDYLQEWYDNQPNSASAVPVGVTAGQDTSGIDVTLVTGASVSGAVRGQAPGATSATALSGICVNAQPVSSGGTYRSASTDAEGRYVLRGLSSSSYVISFRDCRDGTWASQWHAGSSTSAGATTVPLVVGQLMTGLDATLQPGGFITGTVTRRDASGTAAPAAGICLAAETGSGWNWTTIANTQTAADGSYTLRGLSTGSYRVSFGCSDVAREYYDDALESADATLVAVTAGATTSGIDAEVEQAGGIAGTVRDSLGDPVKDLCIYIRREGSNSSSFTRTDAAGAYRMGGLASGSYQVQFSVCNGANLLSEYYDDSAEAAGAALVDVTPGQDTLGIDASLTAGAVINGTVTAAENGAALPGICATALRRHPDGWWQSIRTATTGAGGTYALAGLTADSYIVEFTDCSAGGRVTRLHPGVLDRAAATPVALAAGATQGGIDAVLEIGGSLAGTVADHNGDPATSVCATASGPSSRGTSVDSLGRYRLSGLAAGSYAVGFTHCGNGTRLLEQWYDGKPDAASADRLDVTSSTDRPGIDASLAPGGRIAGTVTDTSGDPVADACIYAGSNLGGASARTDAAGRYTVGGLRTGDYRVSVSDCSGANRYLSGSYGGGQVHLVTGALVTAIDVTLSGGTQMSGTVTGSDNQPLADACVSSWSSDTQIGSTSTRTDARGAYTISVSPGQNYVNAQDCGGRGHVSGGTSRLVTDGVPVTGVDLQLTEGGAVSGTVRTAAGQPLGSACVDVMPATGGQVFGRSDSTGSYLVEGVKPGPVSVRFTDCSGGGHLSQWYSDKDSQEASDQLDVVAGATTSGADATLRPGGSISGTVRNSSGTGIFRSCVTAYQNGSTYSSVTNGLGQYSVRGLRGGSYQLRFLDCEDGAYAEQWFAGKTGLADADSVEVVAGVATDGIDVTLAASGAGTGPTAPGVPRSVTATPGNGLVALSWLSPSSTGSGPLTGYEVVVSPGDRTIPLGADATSTTVTGLANGSTYSFRVRALNDAGPGPLSAAITATPARSTTTVALEVTPNPAVVGQRLSFRVTVAGPQGEPTPSGTVSINASRGESLLELPLVGGVATATTSSTDYAGSTTFTAVYSGDTDFSPATSPDQDVLVERISTTTALSSSANPAVVGQPVTWTATVSAPGADETEEPLPQAAGNVTFTSGEEVLEVIPLQIGVDGALTAALTTTAALGERPVVASYSGDTVRTASTSSELLQVTGPGSTRTSLTSSAPVADVGADVTLTAAVSVVDPAVATASGSVEFFDGETSLGTVALDGTGHAALTVSGLAPGDHQVIARYLGSPDLGASDSSVLVQRVLHPSTTVVTATPAAAVRGQAVALSATVTAEGATPAGSVTFYAGDDALGTAAVGEGGRAVLHVSSLAVGAHSVTASYPEDGLVAASTSAPVALEVARAATAVTLETGPSPADHGSTVRMRATVDVVAPGVGTPTGLVEFLEGEVLLGSALVQSDGTAAFETNDLDAGSHEVVARYTGDGDFLADSSVAATQDIRHPTQTVLLAPSASVAGQPATLTVTITVPGAELVPAGEVTFLDGETVVATRTLDGTGRAAAVLDGLSVGDHTLTARYAGSSTTAASVSEPVSHQVSRAATVTALTLPADRVSTKQELTLVATVSVSAPGAGVPTGRVSFSDGSTDLGSAELDGAGQARLAVGRLSAGTHEISADYSGDGRLLTSSASGQFDVEEGVNTTPAASLTATPVLAAAPADVRIDLSGSDADGDPLTYTLDLGDGSAPLTGALPRADIGHRYPDAGTYVVHLVVSDGSVSDATTTVVEVLPDEPLTAAAGDDQQVVVGTSVLLDASASRPSRLIEEYIWDLGDGTTRSGARVIHTYEQPGTYRATLTTRIGTTTASEVAVVEVVPVPVEPGLSVVVTGSGAPLPAAQVVVVRADGSRLSATTDAEGKALLQGLPDGTVTLYAVAANHRPKAEQATLVDGRGEVTVVLESGAVGAATLESKRLTADEAAARGVDFDDESNFHIYEAKIHLTFVHEGVGFSFTPRVVVSRGGVTCVENCQPPVVEGTPSMQCAQLDGDYCRWFMAGDYGFYPSVGYVGNEPVLNWLVIPVRARFAKEFFDVKMIVQNLTTGFDFEPGTVRLTLPEGISLAALMSPQSLAVDVPAVPGGESHTTSWVVRGDTEGSYQLSASYASLVLPFELPVLLEARTLDPIKIWAGSALVMEIEAEDRVAYLHPYGVRVGLRNVADVPVYNASVEYLLDGKVNYIYQPRENLLMETAVIQPGEVFWNDAILVPQIFGTLDLTQSFVKKTAGNVDLRSRIASVPRSRDFTEDPGVTAYPMYQAVGLVWDRVPDATAYEIYYTPDLDQDFPATPLVVVDGSRDRGLAPLPAGSEGWFTIRTMTGEVGRMEHPAVMSDSRSTTTQPVSDVSLTARYSCGRDIGGTVDFVSVFATLTEYQVRLDDQVLVDTTPLQPHVSSTGDSVASASFNIPVARLGDVSQRKTLEVLARDTSGAWGPTWSATVSSVCPDYTIAVVGDSIAWGQGLREDDKYPTLVKEEIEARTGRRVEVKTLARSGATLASKVDGCPEKSGEVPNEGEPSIISCQIEKLGATSANLVLLNGCINDVGVLPILFDVGVAADTTEKCGELLPQALAAVHAKLPNAKVVLTGYYQIASSLSTLGIAPDCRHLGPWAAKCFIAAGAFTGVAAFNSGQFDDTFRDIAIRAVDGKQDWAAFADPRYGIQDAAYVPLTSRLWELNNDDMRVERRGQCAAEKPGDPICLIAGIGHPNVKGALKYFESITNLPTYASWTGSSEDRYRTSTGEPVAVRDGDSVGTSPTQTVDAAPSVPELTVTTPVGGAISLSRQPSADAPLGYRTLGQSFAVEAPVATSAEPLRLVFRADSADLAGAAPSSVAVTRNGVVVPKCADNTGQASPDPCVYSRSLVGSDVVLTVLTSRASMWQLLVMAPEDGVTPLPGDSSGGGSGGSVPQQPTASPSAGGQSPSPSASPGPSPSSGPASPTPVPTAGVPGGPVAVTEGAAYHPLVPSRTYDSRVSGSGGIVRAGSDRVVPVLGRGGVPSSGVSAVVVNVTGAGATQGLDVQVYPTGHRPAVRTSNLNLRPGPAVAGLVTAAVGTDGTISLSASHGAAHLIVDVVGWYDDGSQESGSTFRSVVPGRIYDTRLLHEPVAAGADRPVKVTGVHGVPATGVEAVIVNTTVLGSTSATDVQLYPAGSAPAVRTSNVNVSANQTRANLAIVKVSDSGEISLSTAGGRTHVVLDVVGWYGAATSTDPGLRFHALAPARAYDSRTVDGGVTAGVDRVVPLRGRAGVPDAARAVVTTATVVGATAPADVQLFPTGSRPAERTSNVNVPGWAAVPNLAVVGFGTGGSVSVSSSAAAPHVLLDVSGYFAE